MKKIIIIVGILITGLLVFGQTKASTTDNVYGWAWSENIGWISFNCYNDYNGDEVQDTNNCSGTNYGVNISTTTGALSGYAWSENIGWVRFDPPGDFVNYSGLGYPTPLFDFAHLDMPDIVGWARSCAGTSNPDTTCDGTNNPLAGGWDGWLRLSGQSTAPVYPGVTINTSVGPPYELEGWAWGGDIVGWVSFNCGNQGSCGSSNYKVLVDLSLTSPPTASDLNVTTGDYCFASAPPVFLNWTFQDDSFQSAYQIQIDNNSDFSSPEVDTGKVASSSESYAPSGLSFNSTYYWRLMVWDGDDTPSSDWIYPASSFATEPRYPRPDFVFCPQNPDSNDTVQFCSIYEAGVCETGTCSDMNSSADNLISCSQPPCIWSWDFGDGNFGSGANPTHEFTKGNYTVELTLTDTLTHSCSKTYPLSTSLALPIWKEIIPF